MSVTDLLLFAASGLGREVLAMLRSSGSHRVIGFLDDDPVLQGGLVDGVPVLGGLRAVLNHPDAMLLLCAGHGSVRRRLAARLAEHGIGAERYARVVHPSACLGEGTQVAAGAIVLAGCVATTGVTLGEHIVLMPHVVLTHDDCVEAYSTLCANVCLGGDVRVRTEAYLGMNASVRQSLTLGARSTLGMGSALLTDLPDDEVWVGSPARRVDPHRTDER